MLQARGAVAGAEGSFLPASAGWYPDPGRGFSYGVKLALPAGQMTVARVLREQFPCWRVGPDCSDAYPDAPERRCGNCEAFAEATTEVVTALGLREENAPPRLGSCCYAGGPPACDHLPWGIAHRRYVTDWQEVPE